MTVLTSVRTQTFSGAGVTQLSLTFPFLENAHLTVEKRNAAGIRTILFEGVHYGVLGAGLGPVGTVTLYSPLVSGESVTVTRTVPLVQPTDLRTQGKFSAEIHEKAFDRRVMQIQDVRWFADHLIVYAESQAEEDEAFRQGARIVIRTDLVTGTTSSPTTTTSSPTTTSSTTTSSTTFGPSSVLLPATLTVANINVTTGTVAGSNVVLDSNEYVEYSVTAASGADIFDFHITGTATASGFLIVNLNGVDVNIGQFPAGVVDFVIGATSIIGNKLLRFRVGTGLGGGTLTLSPVQAVPASGTTTSTTTTSSTTTQAPSAIPIIVSFEAPSTSNTNPTSVTVNALAGTGGLLTDYGFAAVLSGTAAPTAPSSWTSLGGGGGGGISGALWASVPVNGTWDLYFFVRDALNVVVRSLAETMVVAVPGSTTTMSSIPAPVITSPAEGSTLYRNGAGNVVFTGTGVYGTMINLELAGTATVFSGAPVALDGSWIVTVAGSYVPDGAYTVRGRLVETGTTNLGPYSSPTISFTVATSETISGPPLITAVSPNPVTIGSTLTVSISAASIPPTIMAVSPNPVTVGDSLTVTIADS